LKQTILPASPIVTRPAGAASVEAQVDFQNVVGQYNSVAGMINSHE